MKRRLKALRLRMLLPVIAMTLFVVILLTVLFSYAYVRMILRQEQEVNADSFETISRSTTLLIDTSVTAIQNTMMDDRVASYIRYAYGSMVEMLHGRKDCLDYLRSAVTRQDSLYGMLFMREDGSLFGVLPEGNFAYDQPEQNPLPEATKAQILGAPLGQTVWTGPLSASVIYGFENSVSLKNVVIAAWKTVDVRYGDCYAMLLLDEAVFDDLFATLHDGKSTWHLFTADHAEIYHMGEDACQDPDALIRESNGGKILYGADGRPFCTFSTTIAASGWVLVRQVSMEDYAQVVHSVRLAVALIAGVVFLIALVLYHLWLKGFMHQFRSLLDGIVRMGQGDLESATFVPTTIDEFQQMQQEINRTRTALSEQMDTIRRMEREQMALENQKKEQERMAQELSMAREIQRNALPHIFPPFPDRKEIDLYATMDPARDVGGDFYDFYFIDEDHLCLLIADVSGKGIPAAMFMMVAKRILEDSARMEPSVSRILQRTNDALVENNQAEMFVTVWLGILEISSGTLTAANAGHEYPILRRRGGGFELYRDRHGFVIGGMEGVRYREYSLRLEPGDKLFIYTDGVPEATAEGGEMFGIERTMAALNACGEASTEEILQRVRADVDVFVGEAEQFDDLTMMCLEYKGPVKKG